MDELCDWCKKRVGEIKLTHGPKVCSPCFSGKYGSHNKLNKINLNKLNN